AKRKFLPWSRILSIPGPEEQALIIAKAMPDCRLILEWAWRGTPVLTKEVKQVLDAFQGPQLITKGIADAADTEFDEGFSSKHGRKRVSRGVPRDVYDEEAEELPAEDELDEEVGDEFDEEFADEEFA